MTIFNPPRPRSLHHVSFDSADHPIWGTHSNAKDTCSPAVSVEGQDQLGAGTSNHLDVPVLPYITVLPAYFVDPIFRRQEERPPYDHALLDILLSVRWVG